MRGWDGDEEGTDIVRGIGWRGRGCRYCEERIRDFI